MSYTNALYYCDPISGSDTARTALTTCTASNPSGSVTRINKAAHGLVTGAVVDLTLFSSWLNAAWKVTVVDADNFDLDAAVWQATADASGTATPRGGSSKADAWKTHNRTVVANIKAGDTVRVIASPDPTLVGDATWTDDSRTVTLAAAKTADITDCETAWTASANVTATAATTSPKMGTKYASLVIAAGFTTGKVAYFATGTLDLSAYQQVSFWCSCSGLAAGVLTLRLCSDTTGDVTVDTLAIPLMGGTSAWHPVVVDLATNLGSAIQSIALYAESDPGAVTVLLDNIVACKASSSADAITHQSLIGKAHNLSWEASTTYAANTIRKPTQPNRNGYCYKVTAGGGGASGGSEPTWPMTLGETVADGALTWTCTELENTWYALQSISGTTLMIDGAVASTPTSTISYSGTTETVATYKREPMLPPPLGQFSTTSMLGSLGASGSVSSPITITGGWDRTSMAVQSGETWFSLRNGCGTVVVYTSWEYYDFINLNCVRARNGGANVTAGAQCMRYFNCHFNHCDNEGFALNLSTMLYLQGVRSDCNSSRGLWGGNHHTNGRALSFCGSNSSPYGQLVLPDTTARLRDVVCRHGNAYGVSGGGSSAIAIDAEITGLVTAGNNTGGVDAALTGITQLALINPSLGEATPLAMSATSASMVECVIHGFNGDSADNRTYVSGGSIRSVTDQRHTASGVAWKFLPTASNGFNDTNVRRPLQLPVARIACAASATVNVQIWTRRDNANIKGYLFLRGGQIAGVSEDLTVTCEPTINTWEQSSALSFTPTAAGVVEVLFCVYDNVNITNAFWVDDLSIT